MESPQALNYAQDARSLRHRRLVRRLWIVVSLVLLGFVLRFVWTGYLSDRVAWARCWHRAANFTEPPTTPVYTTDPDLAKRLLASGYAGTWNDHFTEANAFQCPTEWADFEGFRASTLGNACVFLHSRVASNRSSRIVAVWAESDLSLPEFERLRIQPETVAWSWIPMPPLPRTFAPFTGLTVIVKRNEPFTLFAGQPDPAGDSHFTISYSMAGKLGVIDGNLRADGTAKLTIRNGPLLGRSTGSD